MEKKEIKRWKRTRLVLLIDATITVVILALLFYRPSGYKSAAVVAGNEVSPYLTHKILPQFYNGIQKKEPFEIIIEQDWVNDIVARLKWPQYYDNLAVSTPSVFFVPHEVKIIGLVEYNNIPIVVTIGLKPEFNGGGKLTIRLTRFKVGAMALTPVAKKIAKKMFTEQIGDVPQGDIVSQILASILAEQPFDPILQFKDDKVRIESLIIESGIIKIMFVPID